MAKCKALTGSAVKGLRLSANFARSTAIIVQRYVGRHGPRNV